MNTTLLIVALILGIGTACAGSLEATASPHGSQTIETPAATQGQHLPPAVIDRIIKDFPGYSLQYHTERKGVGGHSVYEVTLRNISNSEIVLEFTEDGNYRH